MILGARELEGQLSGIAQGEQPGRRLHLKTGKRFCSAHVWCAKDSSLDVWLLGHSDSYLRIPSVDQETDGRFIQSSGRARWACR